MNLALIFAGGTGQRMNSKSKPKQFLELYGKPIIIHTIECFECHAQIDGICMVCLDGWQKVLLHLFEYYGIRKVRWITSGGPTGHDSIFNGLRTLYKDCTSDDIVLIHDGVRPLISESLISDCIKAVMENGNVITVEKALETIVEVDRYNKIVRIPPRENMRIAKAPQGFYLKDIYTVHQKAYSDSFKSIDSAHLMNHYGKELYTLECAPYNIKISTPSDYYVLRALAEARENSQIFGI